MNGINKLNLYYFIFSCNKSEMIFSFTAQRKNELNYIQLYIIGVVGKKVNLEVLKS